MNHVHQVTQVFADIKSIAPNPAVGNRQKTARMKNSSSPIDTKANTEDYCKTCHKFVTKRNSYYHYKTNEKCKQEWISRKLAMKAQRRGRKRLVQQPLATESFEDVFSQ